MGAEHAVTLEQHLVVWREPGIAHLAVPAPIATLSAWLLISSSPPSMRCVAALRPGRP
ncbi:protein of unknown function [Rhodovastum atsumiense]|nr:protein of unknown function [Rhodovastum atsumiense]